MDRKNLQHIFDTIANHSFTVCFWDGMAVQYGSGDPDFQITFNKEPSLKDMRAEPSTFLGEAYMRGDIDISGSFEAMAKVLGDSDNINYGSLGGGLAGTILTGINAIRSLTQQKEDITAHYDLGNDFFKLWLDTDTCSYSCAYFQNNDDCLERAQRQKADLVLKKLHVGPGMRLLDIGCGWGGLATRAGTVYGANVLAITLSEEQFKAVQEKAATNGQGENIEVRLCNYLDLEEENAFDRVVSVGMYEHVGKAHQQQYFEKIFKLLKPGGLSMLHTLTKMKPVPTNPWIKKYIFPGGYIPTVSEVVALMPEYGFHILHVESLRRHYVQTLEQWYERFSHAETLKKIKAMFDDKFVRMWSLYLLMARAFLSIGELDVHQIVFSKGINNDIPMTLESVYN